MKGPGPRHVVIVGATSVIARECARLWLTGGLPILTLVGRDPARTAAVQADLQACFPAARIVAEVVGFTDPRAIVDLVERSTRDDPPDLVLIAHGARADQDACQRDPARVRDALEVNGISPALFAEAFATRLEAAHRGTLVIIGSVSGDRGRRGNYVYGAAKGMLERYAEGLMHRLHASGVRVLLVKPGPTDTPQTAHLRGTGARLARPDAVARGIVRAAGRRGGVVYLPRVWRVVMTVIRHIPHRLFNRMNV